MGEEGRAIAGRRHCPIRIRACQRPMVDLRRGYLAFRRRADSIGRRGHAHATNTDSPEKSE
jgi:hypothetical protein